MFTNDNTNGYYTEQELEKMNRELAILYNLHNISPDDDTMLKYYSEMVIEKHSHLDTIQ